MNAIDSTGQKFNRLLAIERFKKPNRNEYFYKCICDCGNTTVVSGNALRKGKTKSCGCLIKENSGKNFETHKLSKTHLYKVWLWIKDRTHRGNVNCNNNYYKNNIKVCDEWQNDFVSFYNWSYENGYTDEKLPNGRYKWTIDRIDVYGDYSPSNCRWATMQEQQNNRTNNHYITYNGKKDTLANWSRILNFPYRLVLERLIAGYSFEDAIDMKTNFKKDYFEYNGKLITKYDIAEMTGFNFRTVESRFARGWDVGKVINTPIQIQNKKKKEKQNV